MGAYLRDHERGAFEAGGPTDDVLRVTGRPPESFETVTRRHAGRPESRRSAANLVRALAGFMSIPLRPGLDPDRYGRRLCMPRPTTPTLSADSAVWRGAHGLSIGTPASPRRAAARDIAPAA